MLMRSLTDDLIKKLNTVCGKTPRIAQWELFYEFIILSYKTPQDNRYAVSQLYYALKEKNVEEPGEMMKVYAHGLYLLAKNDEREIYDEFNV